MKRPPRTRAERWERRGGLVNSLLLIIMVTMKCAGVLVWPWWRVTLPYWGGIVFMLPFVWWGDRK